MTRIVDLKATGDDLVASIKKVADNFGEHVKSYGDELVEGVRIAAQALPILEASGADLLTKTGAALAFDLAIPAPHPNPWVRIGINNQEVQGNLYRSIPPGQYIVIVLLVPKE